MKQLFIMIAISLFTVSGFAVQKISVSRAKDIQIEQVKCPPDKMCPTVVRYDLLATYQAKGCLDRVEATVEEDVLTEDGRQVVTILGINYHNPRSNKVKCLRMPRTTLKHRLNGSISPSEVDVVEIAELP